MEKKLEKVEMLNRRNAISAGSGIELGMGRRKGSIEK